MELHVPFMAFFNQESHHVEVSGRGNALFSGIETAPGFDIRFIEGVGFGTYLENDGIDTASLQVVEFPNEVFA